MQKILQDFSIPAVFAGFITFLIGISVSAILVIQAAQALGASPEQITSWFWALGLGLGLSGLILSWKFKYPVATAWSTAGLALIIATGGGSGGGSGGGYSINEAIGAFLVVGVLTAILGFSGIFQKALSYIPQSLTSAMLAGVLLKFGISLFASLQNDWAFVLSLLVIYIITKRLWPRYSIVFTALAGVVLCPVFLDFHMPTLHWSLAKPIWISPVFSWSALLGLALPLFVISMASQYLPGIAMIKSYGYKPHVNQLIGWTGLTQVLLAPFGCYSVNIAAISAAVCLDDQVHPDPSKRYIAGMSSGFFYALMGLFAATLTSLLMSFPHIFIVALAGIALLGTISHNIALAFGPVEDREAALFTFLCSASGIQFFGIGSAFWGLIVGLIVFLVLKFKVKKS